MKKSFEVRRSVINEHDFNKSAPFFRNNHIFPDGHPKYPTPATGSENKIVDYLSSLSSSENESKMVHNAKSACDPHREWIEKRVRLGRNSVSIYQDLVERYGFTHKYNSVKRFVRGIKKKDPKQFDR